MSNNELNNVKDALRRIANQLDVMSQKSGTPQASQDTSQGMPLQIGYLLCFGGTIFFFRLTLRHLGFGRLAQFVRKAPLLLNYLEGHLQIFLEFVEP